MHVLRKRLGARTTREAMESLTRSRRREILRPAAGLLSPSSMMRVASSSMLVGA